MPQTIRLKRSAIAGLAPTNTQLEDGEVAINTADGRVFIKTSAAVQTVSTEITEVGSVLTNQTVTGNSTIGGTLGVTGATTFTGTVSVSSGINANGGVTVPVGQTLTVNGDIQTASITSSGSITANGGVTVPVGQTLTVNGSTTFSEPPTYPSTSSAELDGGATIPAGKALTLDGTSLTNVRKFEIRDSAGTIVNGFYVLDTDATITN